MNERMEFSRHYQGKQQTQARQTAVELIPAVGQRVYVRFEDIAVHSVVRDAKSSYGKVRLLVSPMDGAGEQWVELSRLVAPAGHDWSYVNSVVSAADSKGGN